MLHWPAWSCFPLTLVGPAPSKHIWQALSGAGLLGAAHWACLQPPPRDKAAFLTVHSLGSRALMLRLRHRSLLSGRCADRMTCPNTDLVSQTCSDGMLFPHNENTRAFVQRASGKLPRSCICPLIYTLPNKPDPQESDGLCKRWVGCAPSPNPCLLLILRNNRGCSHLPKTPSPEKEGGKAASWLNKAETPVFQKHRCRQASSAAGPSAQWTGGLGW